MRIEGILEKVHEYNPQADVDPVMRAYVFAAKAHKGQERISGEPYLSHPLQVSAILTDLRMDIATVAAGLLHDAVEDTHATLKEIQEHFGAEIAALVDGVTKLSRIPFSTREEAQAENIRKMVLAMSKDIRVILVKLADRLHNMRTLDPLPEAKRHLIARETLDIYAPLAHRLGIYWIKAELEDLALRSLDPEAYRDLAAQIARKRQEREGDLNLVIGLLERKLAEVDITAQITGRPKHFYSIYKKMRDQKKEFDEIYDLTAVRVITDSIKDCYGTLGVIHTLWKPISQRFKDFIAVPKSNGYQSLHTTVIGPKGDPVEIQIRTWEMHRVAEEGIAAHWKYKEGRTSLDPSDESFVWLRQMMEWQRELKDSKEFLNTLKIDLFPDEVYVFTPRGDVKPFPKGATPVDFAFAVHTDVGLRCVGAKVNGRLVPLRTELQNGDIVEILTSPNHTPSRDWLKIVKTPRARGKIRQWIKNEERTRSLSLGRDMLEKEIRRLGKSPSQLLKPEALAPILGRYGLGSEDEFFAAVGYGKVSPRQAVARLLPPEEMQALTEAEEAKEKKTDRKPARPRPTEEGVRIRGIDDILVRFSKCCSPVPGDEIIGFITRGRGVSIHTVDCSNAVSLMADPERQIAVNWDGQRKGSHQVKIRVQIGKDRPGILAEISTAISGTNTNIAQAEIRVTEERTGLNTFVLEVNDLRQLQAAMQAIQKVDGVVGVERIKSL
ncbi:MAG: GTP pyrophosphokinase [candidate division NC10 bacterium RIFCSPLOWO2_12_FULL_66_18]|nr:MAG: GTP pyrophosphokinase [candidate division NC10 bacterium RIFCSPLOWO2_02_FULL_66_22]OGB97341.1 MAG: GTP pyrophosphokinase [candidate division NC10 bacterium RIFCSPLOWO2_12_FULL_66_18]